MFTSGLSFCFVVPPKITIPKPRKMTHGERAELQCAVTGFTPGTISIVSSLQRKEQPLRQLFHWEIPNKKAFRSSTKSFHLEDRSDRNNKDAAFTAEVPKCEPDTKDGTFRVTCRIVMTPNESTDDGAVLIVQVNHEALPVPFTEHFGINIAGVPPKITTIESKPKEIKHGEKTELQWAVTGFTPGKMSIISSLQRNGEQIRQLFHWEAQDKKTFEGKGSAFSLKHLSDGRNKDASFAAQVPKCEKDKDGTFRVKCSITVTPDVSRHNEAELTVQVQHEALGVCEPLIEKLKLHVTGGESASRQTQHSGRFK
uniref:Uncharacterized LOC103172768 n=1 Tax=Callorhinchus milii TaxID=7868 RepID=A0A4W3GGL9_CALMI